MSVNKKRWVKICEIGVTAVLVVTTIYLVAVLSRHVGSLCPIIVDDVKSTSRGIIMSPSDINSSDICSADMFRDYYKTKDYFPGEGRWDSLRTTRDNVSGTLYRFVPDLCKFQFDGVHSLPVDNVRRCLRRRNVTRIVTVGDSNAARYYSALVAALSGGRWQCVGVAEELIDRTLLMPDVRYFGRHDRRLLPLLRATARHCSSCRSCVHRCSRPTSHHVTSARTSGEDGDGEETLWLEHVAMVSVLDSSIKIDVPHNHFVVNLRYRADTFQEFLLKYYLRSRYPDLLIMFPPFNHDKNTETSSSVSIRLQYFLSLIDLYLPNDVEVVWMPSFAEFESRKPRAWAHRRSHGLLATDKLDAFNRLLYGQLRHKLIDQTSPTYGFFDLVRVSAERESWSLDGIHMDPLWYRLIMSYLLQVYCGHDILSAS